MLLLFAWQNLISSPVFSEVIVMSKCGGGSAAVAFPSGEKCDLQSCKGMQRNTDSRIDVETGKGEYRSVVEFV